MEAEKRAKLLARLHQSDIKSAERQKKWDAEISEEDHRWGRMVADISICLGDIMAEKGITQRALAEKMDVNESSVSRLLGKDHNPTLRTLAKLETAIGEHLILTPHSAFRFLATGSVEVPEGERRTVYKSFAHFGREVFHIKNYENPAIMTYDVPHEIISHTVIAVRQFSIPGIWKKDYKA